METSFRLLKLKEPDTKNDVRIFFDSKEAAKQFIAFIKTLNDLEAIERISNPAYKIDQINSPYFISLGQTGTTAKEIFICDYDTETETEKNDQHNICFFGGAKSKDGLFVSRIFASSEEPALLKTIIKRDKAIANGEWDRAWERHQSLQALLDKKTKYTTKSNYT